MKNKNGIYIIGVDHGYGNIKTANCCFPTGVESSDTEPTFKNDLLIYQGRYYQIGVGHKEYAAEKVMDEDYYILTLAAIARELGSEQITQANVFLAAGLPLSWVAKQRKAFQEYLLQNSAVEFTFRRIEYRIRIVGAEVYPQGFAAIASIVNHFTGSNMLCDIGNGTMNILRTLDSNVDLRQMFTEKYGVQQCVLAIQEALMREHHAELEEQMIHNFLCFLCVILRKGFIEKLMVDLFQIFPAQRNVLLGSGRIYILGNELAVIMPHAAGSHHTGYFDCHTRTSCPVYYTIDFR